jgi:predicted GH43/DUF377 family glycosyl hydrolase
LDRLVRRDPLRLAPDTSRVIAQLFVPGHALAGDNEGRASGVVEHVLGLDDDEVTATLAAITTRFGRRHRDLAGTFHHHAERIANRVAPRTELSAERRMLLGATFTHEYAVEAAALCNPSTVAAPDQSGTQPGDLRFVMSVRQIGEGHHSTIGFRSGVIDRLGAVTIDEPGPFTTAGTVEHGTLDADLFRSLAHNGDTESTGWVLDGLANPFTADELDARLTELEAQHDTRRNVTETAHRLRQLASRSYNVEFPAPSTLGERVLVPATSAEAHGMEDARFVRFVDDDGAAMYYATYTAFDGAGVSQQLLATTDFGSFTSSPLVGAAAANKGLALFPRKVNGQFVALSRHDGETNAVAYSDDIRRWATATPIEIATTAWEAVQVGNCGSPIETEDGWLVLTHGVGPMRTYSIGALLLDLDRPTKVIGRTRRPLLTPQLDEQDGYVPNVVYSCGALCHHDVLLVPYGIGDANIGFATVEIGDVLAAMDERSAATIHPGNARRDRA